jgi:hypothetical protein
MLASGNFWPLIAAVKYQDIFFFAFGNLKIIDINGSKIERCITVVNSCKPKAYSFQVVACKTTWIHLKGSRVLFGCVLTLFGLWA